MTPDDILCSADTTTLIKAIRAPAGSFMDALPPIPFGGCLSGPCGCEEGWAELLCAVWGCPAVLLPAVGWVH